MAITLPDAAFAAGLTRLHSALSALLAVEVRQLDELTPEEIALETQWIAELDPVLTDLYWWPLRNGVQEAPEDEDSLKEWLLAAFLLGGTSTLRNLLSRNQRRGANIGGRVGLELMGIGGGFSLQNRDYLDIIDAHAAQLTTPGGDMSLIDTTINHLTVGIPLARANEGNTVQMLQRMIAGWVAVRAVNITVTELSRSFARGLNWVYRRNNVAQQIFQTRQDDRVCRLCLPLHGRIMPVNNIPLELLVPIHAGCRCGYVPYTEGWSQPEQIWRGE